MKKEKKEKRKTNLGKTKKGSLKRLSCDEA